MEFPFEQALVDVWRQVLVENAKVVELGGNLYSAKDSALGRTLF
jgi:hypothetical protein